MQIHKILILITLITGSSVSASAGDVLSQGSFTGASGHVTSGHASIVKEGETVSIVLGSDFNFDGAPDPYVGLGNGSYDPNAQVSKLQSNSGEQVYVLPSYIKLDKYNQVYIWCKQFGVPLGVAQLN